ncbi:TetR/AcrR family transcriptional regulator [Streptomyces cupreus]|uniref:TetR/AcrR family transcriptional regulator n=1 Tax=Streptomyces cupreus TaxID=2759956 RepID=UPI001C917AD1|nr:TetR/AcrR family transcriptional regulator [Streptomyces cupreus]
MAAEKTAPRRVDRRKARTRSALVCAAQRLLAEGRTDVPIQEITEFADIGVGSFYNHFDSKDELFRVAVEETLECGAPSWNGSPPIWTTRRSPSRRASG